MLIEHIEALRKQPKSVRRQAVQFYTTVIVACIVALYLAVRVFVPFIVQYNDSDLPRIEAPYAEARQ